MDIIEAISFLRICIQFSALSATMINRKDGRLYISRLLECYIIVTWLYALAILLYGIFGEDQLPTENSRLDDTVDFIQYKCIRIVHLVTTTEAFRNRRHFAVLIKDVREIDRMFVRCLNVDVDNGSFRRHLIRRGSIMLTLYVCVELCIIIVQLFARESFLNVYFVLYMVPFFIEGLRYFQISSFLIIIRQRLEKLILALNELNLSKSLYKQNQNLSTTFKAAEYPQYRGHFLEFSDLKRLHMIRDLYNRLWELKSLLNENYGYSICVNCINDFIAITANLYWVFFNFFSFSSTSEEVLQTTSGILLCIPHIFNLLTLAMLCEELLQKTTELSMGLHRIESDVDNDNHNTAIEQFSLELFHQKMNVSGAGFFEVNYTLLYSIAGAITTYLIILIQFHLSSNMATMCV